MEDIKKKEKRKEPKKDMAEDRAKKELEKIAAYQARLAKRNNKQKRIRVVMDESNRNFAKKGIIYHYFVIILNGKFYKLMLFQDHRNDRNHHSPPI